MSRVTFLEGRGEAISEEMLRDPKVIMWGSDVRAGLHGLGGSDQIARFGTGRIFDAPLSENAMVGIAVGAAIMGYRPIVDLSVANFGTLAFDQIINQAGKVRYLTGGQAKCSLVVHMSMNTVAAGGSHHTDRHYPMLLNAPGLKVICPTTPRNAKGLWKSAIRDDDPVVIYERSSLSSRREEVPDEEDFLLPLGVAEKVRNGEDVTLVSVFLREECLGAAKLLAEFGVSAEVIDPLSLVPLDLDTILASVRKTGRLVIADLANDSGSVASHIAALVAQHAFADLRSPILRVCTPDVHIPHSRPLERLMFPTKERIASEVLGLVEA